LQFPSAAYEFEPALSSPSSPDSLKHTSLQWCFAGIVIARPVSIGSLPIGAELRPVLRLMAVDCRYSFRIMKMPFRVLVLDDDAYALDGITELLRGSGYEVTASSTYQAAKQLMGESTYDLLISDVRLRSFNGLHLVMQCRREFPEMALMIMTGYDESLMEIEAGRYRAEFIRKPINPSAFVEHVARALGGVRRQRRWPRKPVAGGFRVMAAGRPAAVLEVGYGGLRLEIPAIATVPETFCVEIAGIDLRLDVQPVWCHPSPTGDALVCGATLASDETAAARTWRTIVDRLRA
jgi:DNA-binding response OmpR family regulator